MVLGVWGLGLFFVFGMLDVVCRGRPHEYIEIGRPHRQMNIGFVFLGWVGVVFVCKSLWQLRLGATTWGRPYMEIGFVLRIL